MTQNEIKEMEIQCCIYKNIEQCKSFRFNAGAGAGKTFSLIETLKYVAKNKILSNKSEKKVVCITYTNIAVDEIKKRLGNSEVILVSTIHERVWDLIKKYQSELLICHKEKINDIKCKTNEELYKPRNETFFTNLTDSQKIEFRDYVLQTEKFFHKHSDLDAKSLRCAYHNNTEHKIPDFFSDCLKSMEKFKLVAKLIFKINKLEKCLNNIENGKLKQVRYDSKVNIDRLHSMKFSHDTLLEYGLKLVSTYPVLCRIIVDSYPYFFIDEYQDTHANVVKFVKCLHDYAIAKNKKWMVGYYGDTAQNIYDNGIGKKIINVHPGLVNINKNFNRRSHKQIIDVINNIRSDEIKQVPFWDEKKNGTVKFFYTNSGYSVELIQTFLSKCKEIFDENEKLKGSSKVADKKLHCLVLKNKYIAQLNGFENVYEAYEKSNIYYDSLGDQVLSQQLEKLHPMVLTIYRIVKLYKNLQEGKVSYFDVFGASSKAMTFCKASLVIRELMNGKITSLNDWVELIAERLDNSVAKKELGQVVVNCINYDKTNTLTSDEFKSFFLDGIIGLMVKDIGNTENYNVECDCVLKLPIVSLMKWTDFVDAIECDDIIYHTYHGTKGEEYKNVVVILEHSFGRNGKDKFKDYFRIIQEIKDRQEKELEFSDSKKHDNTKNLLYVACSRAVKNLRILYLDDISQIKEGIEYIFGDAQLYQLSDDNILK